MARFICIHGHFYQPPRENPWLEVIEMQDSAYPYHDWNQRIASECYAPNAASRILDSEKNIIDIVNNYSRISFNFGPTLLSWLEKREPETYRAVIEADRESQKRFSGHGSALAQCYSHMIMPLANRRDKRTQVIWGIKDFEHRFGRKPEGMWLPETAADIETLDIMAGQGIKFTILSPGQAKRIRKIGGKINPRIPYLCELPSGKSIALFFYDGPVSHEIAFGRLLESGEEFAKRLAGIFSDEPKKHQLVHIATDGETYGHHHRFGDMALAYCLYHIEKKNLAKITIYGEYLEKYPPGQRVEIIENSSWSCAHGVGRWRANCGCSSGANPGWHQKWRKSLREAMDWLRDSLIPVYEKEMKKLVRDPWKARDAYVDVILDRSYQNVENFFYKHASHFLSKEENVKTLKLLEMQKYAMFMYTSCGWFFDDISGIETVQVILYAARAIQLAKEAAGIDLEPEFIKRLEKAEGNVSGLENGAKVYEQVVAPEMLDLLRVGAHYAISSLFEKHPETRKVYCYSARSEFFDLVGKDEKKLAVGKVRLRSDITLEESSISFAVLHFGREDVIGGVRSLSGEAKFEELHAEIKKAFLEKSREEIIPMLEKRFGEHSYSLWHLFRDEQRRVLERIARPALMKARDTLHNIFNQHRQTMQGMNKLQIQLPMAFYSTVRFVLNDDLRKLLEEEELDLAEFQKMVDKTKEWPVKLDRRTLCYHAGLQINRMMNKFLAEPESVDLLSRISDALKSFCEPPLQLDLDLWKAQNIFFSIGKKIYASMKAKSERGNESAIKWIEKFTNLGKYLKVKIK
jgi:alpha-amylase/alpha-mannosidase (GH57 family)